MKSTRKRTSVILGGLAGAAIWVTLWQLATTVGPLKGMAGIPTASDSFGQAFSLAGQPRFWAAVLETLTMALTGLVIALAIGIVVGVVTGLSKGANDALDPMIQFLRPLPAVVILPLVLLIFGPTRDLGIFLAAFGAVWPILVQVQVGVRDVDPVALDTARSMSLSWRKTQTAVVLPSALPYISTGVRIAASAALLLSIGAGLLAGSPGLGKLILIAQEAAQADVAFGLIVWSGLIGTAFAIVLSLAEKSLIHGRRSVEVTS